jgi:hypothetical protein
MIHLASCPKKYNTSDESPRDQPHYNHNPLKSSYENYPLNDEFHFASFGDNDDHSSGTTSEVESILNPDPEYDNFQIESQGQYSTAVSKVQIKLNHIINSHKAPLKLYDDVVNLFNEYISSPNLDIYAKFKTRTSFIQSIESSHSTTNLAPMNRDVTLHDGKQVTVPVFDAKSMIIDLISSHNLMKECNIAEGYDLYTGNVDINHPSNNKYGEIHTGDDWLPVRDRFCQVPDVMPVALVIFGDKSHTDLHGALSLTPVIFTLTLFNRVSRNNPKFWRPLGYIPNLGYGKNKADKTETKNKIQDEHKCLACILESVCNIHRSGGFDATVMGKAVKIKVWIHFFIGDTEGNNKWVGHFPGNKSGVKRPYRDCRCSFADLSNPNPTCVLATLEEMKIAKRTKKNNEAEGLLL